MNLLVDVGISKLLFWYVLGLLKAWSGILFV